MPLLTGPQVLALVAIVRGEPVRKPTLLALERAGLVVVTRGNCTTILALAPSAEYLRPLLSL